MSETSYPKPTVGMEVFVVWCGSYKHRGSGMATITKVGNKWAELDNGQRFPKDGTRWHFDAKGFQSQGEAFPSAAHYQNTVLRVKEYQHLKNRLGYNPPEGVSRDDIRQAAILLGIIKEGEEL